MENDIKIESLVNDLVAYTVMNSPDFVPDKDLITQNTLTDMQQEHIQGLINGNTPKELCQLLGIPRIQPYLWGKKCKLFADAVEIVSKMKTDDLESQMWQSALTETANPITQMFLLKAKKPEYKENAQPQEQGVVNIKISIGEQQYKVVDITQDSVSEDT